MSVCVVMPTMGRTEQARACVARICDTAPQAAVVVVTRDNREVFESTGLPGQVRYCDAADELTAVQKWNYGLKCALGFDAYVLGADDLWPQDGWLDAALEAASLGFGFVGLNDCHTDGAQLATHFLVTRDFIASHLGGVLCVPHYRAWYLDVEATARAKRAHQFAYAVNARVDHRHVHWGKAEMDETYRRGYAVHRYDMLIHAARERAGYPNDYVPIINKEPAHV